VRLKPPGGGGKRLDGSLRFLASGEKPRLEGKSGRIDPAHWREMIRDLSFRQSFDRRFDQR